MPDVDPIKGNRDSVINLKVDDQSAHAKRISSVEVTRKTPDASRIKLDSSDDLNTRSVTKHLTPEDVTDNASFQKFISSRYDQHAGVADASSPKGSTVEAWKNLVSELTYPCVFLVNTALDNLSIMLSGKPRMPSYELTDTQKASASQRAKSAGIFFAVTIAAIATAVLTAIVLLPSFPVAAIYRVYKNKSHAKKMTRIIFTSLLHKTFEKLEIDGISKNLWQELAKSLDRGIKNIGNINIDSITTNQSLYSSTARHKNIKGDKLNEVFIKIVGDHLQDTLKKLPNDESGNNAKTVLESQFFDKKNNLKKELQKAISITTKDLVRYTDQIRHPSKK